MNTFRMRMGSFRLLASVGALAVSSATMAPPASAAANQVTFDVPGTYTWTVPAGVRAPKFDVWGAQGGRAANGQFGGFGGRAIAIFSVIPNESIEINVGGAGGDSPTGQFAFGRGGYNGGANGGSGEALALNAFGGGGGGGASDARRAQFGQGVNGRFIVGGGGGGGSLGCVGGAGGSPFVPTGGGCDKWSGGQGSANGGGGSGGTKENDICCSSGESGLFGTGGKGATVPLIAAAGEGVGGGGGGGGYGGGGGGSSGTHVPNTGFASIGGGAGGGGSSFIGTTFVLVSFTPVGGVRPGNGLVTISYFVPTVAASASPSPNSFGWNSTNVDVAFSGSNGDPNDSPPIASITYSTSGGQVTPETTVNTSSTSVTVSTDGVTTVRGIARDSLGDESAPASVEVKIDRAPPSIFGGRNVGSNANGWNNTDVTVTWACSDALSGIQTCAAPTVIDREGSGQIALGIASDLAGNAALGVVQSINIDKTPPRLTSCQATNATDAGALISWTTNEPADSQVDFGPTAQRGTLTPLNMALSTSHTMALTGLQPGTQYHVQPHSVDVADNSATCDDFTFTTMSSGGGGDGGCTLNCPPETTATPELDSLLLFGGGLAGLGGYALARFRARRSPDSAVPE